MALDVTIGGESSESYATVSEADAYHVAYGNAAWAALATPAKEIALRKGARYVDTYKFTGEKPYLNSSAFQRLQWPRQEAYLDNFPISSSVIPKLVKDAQCEAALKAATMDLQSDIKNGSVIEETIGPMTVKYSDYSVDGGTTFTVVDDILAPLLSVFGGKNFHRVSRT